MPAVVYLLPDGTSRRVDVEAGTSVMFAAVHNNVRGIDGECGACLSCATCHVYVDEAFAAKLPPATNDELDMLTGVAAERRPTSRLSCQISMTPELDGLVVRIPEKQS